MRFGRWAGGLVLAGSLVACQWHKKVDDSALRPPPPVPATAETREAMQRLAPNAIIGRVAAVYPDEQMASVGDLPVDKFNRGDVVTFVGGEEKPIASGEVLVIVKDKLHVRYVAPGPEGRVPVVGDLAIRYPNPHKP